MDITFDLALTRHRSAPWDIRDPVLHVQHTPGGFILIQAETISNDTCINYTTVNKVAHRQVFGFSFGYRTLWDTRKVLIY